MVRFTQLHIFEQHSLLTRGLLPPHAKHVYNVEENTVYMYVVEVQTTVLLIVFN